MRTHRPLSVFALAALLGCGLENVFSSAPHGDYQRPASAISGTAPFADVTPAQVTVTDGEGNALTPFRTTAANGSYEVRLPSGKYQMIFVHVRSADLELRALVPSVGEESTVRNVNVDARSTTEALISEARLSAKGLSFKKITPSAYLATSDLIHAAFAGGGPAQALLGMVQRLIGKHDPTVSVTDPFFFRVPVLKTDFSTRTSAIDPGWLARNPFDYDGDGIDESDTAKFDAALGQAAQTFKAEGCPATNKVRVVFTVDFNQSGKTGNCGTTDRFKWATDKPGKTMFFVGWVHKDSPIQDPAVNSLLGASTPNQIQMYDDGTNGDATSGDNVYTVSFDLPRGSPGNRLRMGYKYTWGTRGAIWTGSEEWPGNSRILEVEDENADEIVYRHDVFGDEATNKDNSNLNFKGNGSIGWSTDLHGCGPEAHENKYDNGSCTCGDWQTPKAVGPLTVACTSP